MNLRRSLVAFGLFSLMACLNGCAEVLRGGDTEAVIPRYSASYSCETLRDRLFEMGCLPPRRDH
jgi:hypothetical protein